MSDMSQVIVAKSDQINADDLVGGPRTIRIAEVKISPDSEQPVSIAIEGEKKVWRPCKTASRVLVAAWGPDANLYVGRTATLYRDPNVKWGGLAVGGIRISAMSDIDPRRLSDGKMTISLKESRNHSKPTVVQLIGDGQAAKAPKQPPPPSPDTEAALAAIAACTKQSELRAWWQQNNEAIEDGHYDAILAAFNERLAAVKNAKAPAPDEPETGRDTADMGEAVSLEAAKDMVGQQTEVADVNRLVRSLAEGFDEKEADELKFFGADRCEQILREKGGE